MPKVDPRNKMGVIVHAILVALHRNCPLPLCLHDDGEFCLHHDNNNDDNNNDNKDDLVWFANNASLALSCLCGHVGRLTSMTAAAAAAAANASS